MDEVLVIRHMVSHQGKSRRKVARELGVSRNTVRKYLEESEPVRRESGPRARPVLERVRGRIDALLDEWSKRTTKKQYITATRLHRELVEEGFKVGVTTVRNYFREWKRRRAEVYVPLVHRPGDSVQVDFFEVTVEEKGQRRKAWKFLMRSMFSGRDFVALYPRCDQVAFLDGHVRAFEHFGVVPCRGVYDNLSAAVKRRVGMHRELTDRFKALVSHYGFEACFARPGEGHDKGGVESRGKSIRLQHLTPVPQGDSLAELSLDLQTSVDRLAGDKRDKEGKNVFDRFEEERPFMLPLPPTPFEACRVQPGIEVSRKATVRFEGGTYSVPSSWARLSATALVGPEELRLLCGDEEVTHPRVASGQRSIRYRHYLRELARKPQALRQVAPELMVELGAPFALFWERLCGAMEPLDAARRMAEVLRMIPEHGEKIVRAGLERALADGLLTLLDIEALRKESGPKSVQVPESLRGFTVETARATDFDKLLEGGAL